MKVTADDEPPKLTADIVEDDQALGEAVDLVVYRDVEARRRQEETMLYADVLREVISGDEWRIFLRIDELRNARWSELVLVIARWAFTAGVRSVSQPPGSASRPS